MRRGQVTYAIVIMVIGVYSKGTETSSLNKKQRELDVNDECEVECGNFDLTMCDQTCVFEYQDDETMYDKCLEDCAEEYIYCQFELRCNMN